MTGEEPIEQDHDEAEHMQMAVNAGAAELPPPPDPFAPPIEPVAAELPPPPAPQGQPVILEAGNTELPPVPVPAAI